LLKHDNVLGRRVLVAGGGGFIGGYLVADLLRRGAALVRAVDLKPLDEWYQRHGEAECQSADLRSLEACKSAVSGVDVVYNLACDMGGMGFIELNRSACMLSVLINTHLLSAARDAGVERYFFSSSACVYNVAKQRQTTVVPLREADAYPAMPEDGYGWEKLFSERLCLNIRQDFGLETRIARYHNIYGPHGTYAGGREKAPAAICRKVAQAKLNATPEIEIWGDGEQTRSFTYIDDCLTGTNLLMWGDVAEPLNVGSSELVSINRLVDIVERIADIKLDRNYRPDAPQGVRGRSSDNQRIQAAFGWEPRISLEKTYRWIFDACAEAHRHGTRDREALGARSA
jgi:GDP-D-mannose 3',5'-epimerase